MRNRIFNQLKKEDREKILMRTLREKTQGLLQVSEEACLLSRLSTAKQFRIDVTFDAAAIKGVLTESNADGRTVLYGESALEKFDSSVAVWIAKEFDAESTNRVVIYIPPQRKAKYRKTFIVED